MKPHRYRGAPASVPVGPAIAIGALGLVLAGAAPAYFSAGNLTDLFLANLPVLVVAIGATLVIMTGEIDVSVGSMFAICSVVAGEAARSGWPLPVVGLVACLVGCALGSLNGALVAYVRMPSIVVTLATMVALRDALRWVTQGAWVQDLPAEFQWFGSSQQWYPIIAAGVVIALLMVTGLGLRHVAAGRAIYATGSNPHAARLAGIDTALVKFSVFSMAGTCCGLGALLNAVRFNQIPPNVGLGLEMKVIAAVIVGGAAITGGSGSMVGTLLGVVLLGAIGPALTFLGVSAYWERAIQGGIILVAVTLGALRGGVASPIPRRAAHTVHS